MRLTRAIAFDGMGEIHRLQALRMPQGGLRYSGEMAEYGKGARRVPGADILGHEGNLSQPEVWRLAVRSSTQGWRGRGVPEHAQVP